MEHNHGVDDRQLYEKIVELFNYRQFPFLYQLTGEKMEVLDEFNRKLIELQASIYYLDAYLESSWHIDDQRLASYWLKIASCLSEFGIDPLGQKNYIKHILKYQRHELQLRSGLLPHRLSMEYFYFYKSCDVKLIRRLIYENFPILNTHMTLSEWRYFDLITEVNDDVVDIFEDMSTINCNRFLLSSVDMSKGEVFDLFENFFDYIHANNTNLLRKNHVIYQRISELTEFNLKETRLLFYENYIKFMKLIASESPLINYIQRANG